VAAEIKRATGLDTQLIVGSSGEFTVWLDGKLVAEKQSGRFPEPAAVVAAVKAATAT
jgi:predicted Rdx family selenoprotein